MKSEIRSQKSEAEVQKPEVGLASHISPARSGMILVIVVGCLVFTMIIFAGMVKRIRGESMVTNRTYVSERMYQIASAIGRLTVRKLQRDFETRDPKIAKKIIDGVFKNNQETINDLYYTDDIMKLDVTKEIITQFRSKWGGDLDVTVKTVANLGNGSPFSADIPGLEKSPFERLGNIDVEVAVSHKGVKKKCRIRKDFLLVRLFAPPFHKFTLFARRGAELDPAKANRVAQVSEDGKVTGNQPLVLYNRLIRSKKKGQDGLDFTLNRPNNIIKTEASFVNNGWIYLGGQGKSTDATNKSGNLILNIGAGAENDPSKPNYGEFFHFFFEPPPGSRGWLGSREWNTLLDSKISGNSLGGGNHRVMVTFVDYGLYTGLVDLSFSNGIKIFKGAAGTYRGDQALLSKGSALHLFGTPGLCTPTLVFGQVKRRYVRTFSFYFTGVKRIYPIRAMQQVEWESPPQPPNPPVNLFFSRELGPWATSRGVDPILLGLLEQTLTADVDFRTYYFGKPTNSPPLCRIPPEFRDWEPYMLGLKNISQPTDPGMPWSSAVPNNIYIRDKPDLICNQDYTFTNDPELHYSGKIRDLRVTSRYLKEKMSYYITDGKAGSPLKLSKCKFFMDKFVDRTQGKNQVFLNQIIGFENDLEIDIPLEVLKGGVIYCKGRIKISAPVVNPFINNKPSTPDAFGYITFVSDNHIELSIGAGSSSGLPEFHGFLVCFNSGENGEVEIKNSVHIIGGVAADIIEKLVENGGVIEYGYEPGEISGMNDFSNPDFYGLAMGPRDFEVVEE